MLIKYVFRNLLNRYNLVAIWQTCQFMFCLYEWSSSAQPLRYNWSDSTPPKPEFVTKMFNTRLLPVAMAALTAVATAICFSNSVFAQSDDTAVVRGRIAFERGEKQKIPYTDMEVKLRERVELPAAPVPRDFEKRTPAERKKWVEAFEKSPAGKKFVKRREQLIEDAKVFDVLIEKNGSFVVYDVPTGIYGIQSRLDKEIDGTTYAYEVFGEIAVSPKVDEVPLAPILIEITPLLKQNQKAPPIAVSTYDNKAKLGLNTFKGRYVFVNFWSTENPDIEPQKQVQKMYTDLKGKYSIALLSICIDEKRKAAVKFILEKNLREGSHGFTGGWEHPTVDGFGVRSTPSFWLIDPRGKIIMTQYNFGQIFANDNRSMTQIVSDRIEGKDTPTPAAKKE